MRSTKPGRFSAFTVKFAGRINKILTLVAITHAFDPKKDDEIKYPQFDTQALWDTGATRTFLSPNMVKMAGLIPSGRGEINHAGGTDQTSTYLINVLLPNHVRVVAIPVSEWPNEKLPCGLIIGMDIICRGDFSITNIDDKTCVSFCMPSMEIIDYVLSANKLLFAGVHANDPCPCGKVENGQRVKFRNCHQRII